MSRLTLHFQTVTPWAREFVERAGARYVKLMDPPAQNPFAGLPVAVIGRQYMPESVTNALIWQAEAGACAWVEGMLPAIDRARYVAYWELPNEPHPLWDVSFRHALDDFSAYAVQRLAGHGVRAVALNWSVGWPDVGHAPDFAGTYAALDRHGGLLGAHEYGAPYLDLADEHGNRWYGLRITHTLAEIAAEGLPLPAVFIGECGIDGGLATPRNQPPMPLRGWKTYDNNPRSYVGQLLWYERRLPEQVVAAAVFNAGSLPPWGDFDLDRDTALLLAESARQGRLP